MKAVFDSDILIDYLQGLEKARKEIALYSVKCISMISWMEVMCGADGAGEESKCRGFLAQFEIIGISIEVAERAVRIRREQRLKLPDAIIWATAQQLGCVLVTRNTKDFPLKHPGVRVPYKVS